jgi:WD40 repeat protein
MECTLRHLCISAYAAAATVALSGCGDGVHAARGLKPLEVLTFSGKHANGTLAVAALSGGGTVVSSGGDGTTRIWDVTTGTETRRFSGPAFHFRSIAFAPDGKHVLTAPEHAAVRYWTLDGKETREFSGPAGFALTSALSADGGLAVTAAGATIHMWDIAGGRLLRDLPSQSEVVRVGFGGSGQGVLAVEASGQVCRWAAPEYGPPQCFSVGTDPVSRASLSSDGRVALIGTQFGKLELWDVEKQASLLKFSDLGDEIVSIALSADGSMALLGGADKMVRLWNLTTRRQLSQTRGSGSYISCVAFSPDGSNAVFGSDDGEVALWRLR